MHWVALKKLCLPKKDGGLGFRDFKLFNWGMQAWSLMSFGDFLLHSILKARYFQNTSFMESTLGTSPS